MKRPSLRINRSAHGALAVRNIPGIGPGGFDFAPGDERGFKRVRRGERHVVANFQLGEIRHPAIGRDQRVVGAEQDLVPQLRVRILDEHPGFVSAHWDGTPETEDKIKELAKATIRCIPLNNELEEGKCILTGKHSVQRVLFARAY